MLWAGDRHASKKKIGMGLQGTAMVGAVLRVLTDLGRLVPLLTVRQGLSTG